MIVIGTFLGTVLLALSVVFIIFVKGAWYMLPVAASGLCFALASLKEARLANRIEKLESEFAFRELERKSNHAEWI